MRLNNVDLSIAKIRFVKDVETGEVLGILRNPLEPNDIMCAVLYGGGRFDRFQTAEKYVDETCAPCQYEDEYASLKEELTLLFSNVSAKLVDTTQSLKAVEKL